MPAAVAESASALLSASAQALFGALGSWAPAGAAAHKPRTFYDAAAPGSPGGAGNAGAGAAYSPPPEDAFATAAEAAEFAPSAPSNSTPGPGVTK